MPKQNNYTRTEEELAEIREAMKSHNARVVKRASMVHNLHQGYTPNEVAQLHNVSEATVYNWFNRYQAEGIEGLKNKPKSGRPPKADVTYRQRLVEVVESSPQDHDLGFSVWTLPSLQAFMERETGIHLSQNRISEVLQEEGYVYRRPKKDLGHRQDPVLREQVRDALDEVKKTHEKGMSGSSIWTKVDSA
jgi:putative transposase